MARREVINAVRERLGCSYLEARDVTVALLDMMRKELKKKGRFVLTGFGTFSVRRIKARKGRNPKTGEAIRIRATKTVRFKASRTLRNSL